MPHIRNYLFLYLFIAICVITVGFLFVYPSLSVFFTPPKLSTAEFVRKNNPSFMKGYEALSQGNFVDAAKYFELALTQVQDTKQEAYIKNFQGYSLGLAGEYEKGIDELKSVASNETYADTHRAYALEFMGEIYYLKNKDPRVTSLIFNSPPYSAFLAGKDVEGAYKKLYEYAQTLFPTGNASYRLSVINFYKDSTSTAANIKIALPAIQDEIIILNGLGVTDGAFYTDKYLKIAILEGLLALKGDNAGSGVEKSFQKAVSIVPIGTNEYLRASYFYALFLSQKYGQNRSQDIARLLTPFYDPAYKNTTFYRFLADRQNQENQQLKMNIQSVAQVDQRFKTLMESLGWIL